MGWILGYRGGNFTAELTKFSEETLSPLFTYKDNNLFISAGGIAETCSYSADENTGTGWVVSGLGIKDTPLPKLMNTADWNSFLLSELQVSAIDGHFVIAKWDNSSVKLYTDVVGLRDVYYAGYNGGTIFSTRADWLAKFVDTDIDMEVFSTRWLCFNQLSRKSILKNIHRASQGEVVTIGNEVAIEKKYTLHIDDKHSGSPGGFTERLQALSLAGLESEHDLSLSLSGGMDSRVILSLLLNQSGSNWDAHTFGNPFHPDSAVSQRICEDNGITHEQIDMPLQTGSGLGNSVNEYVMGTLVNGAVSSVMQLNNYYGLANRNKLLIDGGFGELWRGEFFKKLQLFGKKHILNKDYVKLLALMRIDRGDIFNEQTNKLMYEAALNQIEEIVNELPNVNDTGMDKWTDMLALRTRTLNYYGHEQARLDNIVPAYMPFLQPSLLKYLWSVRGRKNAKLFKEIIKANARSLTSYPLVKGDLTLPYGLTSVQNRVLSIVKKKLGGNFTDNRESEFTKNYPLRTNDIEENEYLDADKVEAAINGNTKDWLLAFVIFYNNIKKRLKTD